MGALIRSVLRLLPARRFGAVGSRPGSNRPSFKIDTMTWAAFAGAALFGYGCATDTRYHDAALAAVSDADRKRCEQLADAARARATTYSLRDLNPKTWRVVIPAMFDIPRVNETERRRAYEEALLSCLEQAIERRQ